MTRAEVIAEAQTWIGTPWSHQASCRGAGADCIGLIAGVYAACGSAEAQAFLDSPTWRRYSREPNPAFMFAGCDAMMDRLPVAQLGAGDVLVFACGRLPNHFGIVVDDDDMIHSWLVAKRVARHRLDKKWRSRIVRAYRPRGLE